VRKSAVAAKKNMGTKEMPSFVKEKMASFVKDDIFLV
jgi:hypothetical protein